MKNCQKCKIKYPDGYLAPIMTSKGNAVVCGVCALELSNAVTGMKRKKFQGEEAERLRQLAIEFRKSISRGLGKAIIVKQI